MDSNHQSSELLPSIPVVLNIGLGEGSYSKKLWAAARVAILGKRLKEVLEPGFKAELHLVPDHVWVGEPLMVVVGMFREDIAKLPLLWEIVAEVEQDCIAIHYPTMPTSSTLFGPKADDWGIFEPSYFVQPKGEYPNVYH
jgi:hypothetical protein